MPGSTRHGKQIIKKYFGEHPEIKSVIDVGCGSGTYPKLLGSHYKWTGIDVFAPYIEKFNLKDVYDEIIIGQAEYIDWRKLEADAVILGDVIEHLPKKEGRELVRKLFVRYKHVIISLPVSDEFDYESDMHYGNQFERHVSYWKFDEMYDLMKWQTAVAENNIGVFIK